MISNQPFVSQSHFAHPSVTNAQEEPLKSFYIKTQKDGIEFFEQLRIWGTILVQNGTITMMEAFQIEDALKDVKSLIVTGDWRSAQALFSFVTVVDLANNADMYNFINNTINTYVAENY